MLPPTAKSTSHYKAEYEKLIISKEDTELILEYVKLILVKYRFVMAEPIIIKSDLHWKRYCDMLNFNPRTADYMNPYELEDANTKGELENGKDTEKGYTGTDGSKED